MRKKETCRIITEIGIVPAIRVSSAEDAAFAAEAIALAGIPIVEITMTVPGAVAVIARLARDNPKVVIGAGTVLTLDVARECADAGASFLTAPGFDAEIVEFAAQKDLAALPGALTPTEVVAAWRAGADIVKVFPCTPVGGSHYIKSLKTSLKQIPLMAAGGVNQRTAMDFILAGAVVIGVGAELIPTDAILQRSTERVRELARRFLGYVKEARDRLRA
ncbi:MAG: bifunctional 4-hydroxy-2-oxoglutarate aldolase/2-dehydro-3-deoxy-phosphogluconate aldolase [Bryobacteraceae bacterium]